MSKESYARGFCKAAAAAGVDPEALAKYAEASDSAGIGTVADNSRDRGGMAYLSQLRAMSDMSKAKTVKGSGLSPANLAFPAEYSRPYTFSSRSRDMSEDMTEEDLEKSRIRQEWSLKEFSPVAPGVPTETLLQSLRQYIRPENLKAYKETGVVPDRKEMDTRGLEKLKLTDEQKEMIRMIQNSSARLRPRAVANSAVA